MLSKVDELADRFGQIDGPDGALARLDRTLADRDSRLDQAQAARQAMLEQRLEGLSERTDALRTLEDALGRALADLRRMHEEAEIAEQEHQSLELLAEQQRSQLKALDERLDYIDSERRLLKKKYKDSLRKATAARTQAETAGRSLARAEQDLQELQASRALRILQATEQGWDRVFRPLKSLVPGSRGKGLRARQAEAIRRSAFFDGQWYLAHHSDVAASGIDPAEHYLEHGWREGRNPGPDFSTKIYLKRNRDVAASGLNPLLHYIEHGEAEGRDPGGAGTTSLPAPAAAELPVFEAAAPVVAPARDHRAAGRWVRSAQLVPGPSVLQVQDVLLGSWGDGGATEEQGVLVRAFLAMAGSADGTSLQIGDMPQPEASDLEDAWFVGLRQLRTRWRSPVPDTAVLRAVQIEAGEAILVGEGAIAGSVSLVDLRLRNRMKPVLFVLSDAQGSIRKVELLAFPSLCRGGVHESEAALLLTQQRDGPHQASMHQAMTRRLLRRMAEKRLPACSTIVAYLDGADGTHPLFEREVQLWLRDTFAINLQAAPNAGSGSATDHLRDSLVKRFKDRRPTAGGVLALTHDMVPTIAVLTADVVEGSAREQPAAMAYAVSFSEPSARTLFIDDHGRSLPSLTLTAGWRLADSDKPLVAIAAAPRPLQDGDLLQPVAGLQAVAGRTAPPVTLVLRSADWDELELQWALECLAAQTSAESISLIFVGEIPPGLVGVAERLFASRIDTCLDPARLAEQIRTPLFGYLGGGVLLHGTTTLAFLSDYLGNGSVVTASVPLVLGEQRGSSVVMSVQDLGLARRDASTTFPALEAAALWRGVWDVRQPPRDFWVARTGDLMHLMQDRAETSGRHLCCGLQSASYASSPTGTEALFDLAPASTSSLLRWVVR
jgi:hypothetical protein